VTPLPVVIGFGGINAAGRSSFHHAFRRIVYHALPPAERDEVLSALARLMGLPRDLPAAKLERQVLDHSLVRKIEPWLFDVDRVYRQERFEAQPAEGAGPAWIMQQSDLPSELPTGWATRLLDDRRVEVSLVAPATLLVPDHHRYSVRAAATVPTGFRPATRYPAKNHPRGLQLAVYGSSDAVRSVGIGWSRLLERVPADRVAVYASSAMGQLDPEGAGGMLAHPMIGKHTSSRHCPFSLPQMPADFINAYVVGSIGRTAGLIGACATFLYNLEKAVRDIQTDVVDLAVVGAAEAPVFPEVLEGYRAMGALSEDPDLLALDGLTEGEPDHRRACRPFAPNCGFVMGESAQYLVLMKDELALALGASIYAAVPGVYIHADGTKQSISSPGIGNYLTLGKACSLAREILGDQGLRHRTMLHAHGTGTPQNRVTESHVFDRVAHAFDVRDWVVAATKCFVGHSLGAAAGDQTSFALGTFATGVVPGITTVTRFADDVHAERLSLSIEHRRYDPSHWQGIFINTKGFGGNNATGLLLSPEVTWALLQRKHGEQAKARHWKAHEQVQAEQERYRNALLEGHDEAIYNFGSDVVEGTDLVIDRESIRVPGFPLPVSLTVTNPYGRVGRSLHTD
jgi:acetoacetyl-[acyl-carrier protein] synthase